MTNSWPRACSEFFSLPYSPAGWDCADLTLAVQRKLFGRGPIIPDDRHIARRHLRRIFAEHLESTAAPQDGDVVLMRECGRLKADHVGTYLVVGGEPCVLHTTQSTDTTFTRLRHLADLGLRIEDIYTWRAA